MFDVRARRATVHVPRISFHVPEFRFMCQESPQLFFEGYHQQQPQHYQHHHFVPNQHTNQQPTTTTNNLQPTPTNNQQQKTTNNQQPTTKNNNQQPTTNNSNQRCHFRCPSSSAFAADVAVKSDLGSREKTQPGCKPRQRPSPQPCVRGRSARSPAGAQRTAWFNGESQSGVDNSPSPEASFVRRWIKVSNFLAQWLHGYTAAGVHGCTRCLGHFISRPRSAII